MLNNYANFGIGRQRFTIDSRGYFRAGNYGHLRASGVQELIKSSHAFGNGIQTILTTALAILPVERRREFATQIIDWIEADQAAEAERSAEKADTSRLAASMRTDPASDRLARAPLAWDFGAAAALGWFTAPARARDDRTHDLSRHRARRPPHLRPPARPASCPACEAPRAGRVEGLLRGRFRGDGVAGRGALRGGRDHGQAPDNPRRKARLTYGGSG